MVECLVANENVIGSNPISCSKFRSQSVHGRTRHCHCRRRGSLPLETAKFLFQCSTAVVQLTVNQLVVGSIPATGASFYPSVAQSGSAPALGAGGPRFESLYSDHGGLVIMGAHVLCKHEVGVRSSHPPPKVLPF